MLIPFALAEINVDPVAGVNPPLPLSTNPCKSKVALLATAKVPEPVPRLRLLASCTVLVLVPLPAFQLAAAVMVPLDCVMVWVPDDLLKVKASVPVPDF